MSALQRRHLPAIRQAILKVPGFSMICDQTGLWDAEPTLLFSLPMGGTADHSDQ